ncbi:hypothetical protein P7K49_001012 [Saguinus oedipus]|uniref:Uncharacterized protein n=1 Tax=Saguinus oedipus TaxID=9490 RepID=A0ABQ9WDD4_SAGOE|nr:hypothetical protein P7K49_001012 [Saguinus oedipus]
MKKNQTVQGTFSKFFGKMHATRPSISLYATNPPWIFTQEAPEEGTRGFDGIYYGDNRFNTVSESGTATLKAWPRVRPLLTFLPLNAQENHGLAVPTPSVPEDFADKEVTGTTSLVNGNLRLYSSVGDLRPGQYGQDLLIPPSPPGPAPGPPQDISQPPWESTLPLPPSTAPPPPPLLLEPRLHPAWPHLHPQPSPTVASQSKEGKKGLSLPAKDTPLSFPEKSLCDSSLTETEAPSNLTLPTVDYIPQDSPTPSVWQIRNELEARLSSSAEKEAKPSIGFLPPKPSLEVGRIFENGTDNNKISKPCGQESTTLNYHPAANHITPAQGHVGTSHTTQDHTWASHSTQKPHLVQQPQHPRPYLGQGEVPCLYKPYCRQSSPSGEVGVVMPTLAKGEAAGPGEPVEMKEPLGLPAKPPAPAQPTDELLRHPVTGEGRPNSFTVVPKLPKEAAKGSPLTTEIPNTWGPQPGRDTEGTQPSSRHNWTKTEPQAPVAWEKAAPSNPPTPRGRPLPKSFSSPPSPSYKREEEEEEEEKEFSFEVIPPPSEFSNDAEPPAPALQYLSRRGCPPRNNYSDLGQTPDAGPAVPPARGFSRFPADAHYTGAGGLDHFSGAGH